MKLIGLNKMGEKVSGKLCPNYVFKVIKMNNKIFTLEDILDKTTFEVSVESIFKNFSLPYTNTVHAAQGDKINEKFVIADYNHNNNNNGTHSGVA